MARRRTLAERWNQGGNHSKITILVLKFDAVLIGLFGCESRRWARGNQEVASENRLGFAQSGRLVVGDGSNQ